MEQTQTASSGLLSAEGARVPLVGVSARAEIRDYVCRVVLSQRFRNNEAQPIEAVYKFPLEEGSAVCGFEVEIDGRVITGHVEEREKAFETYDEALSAGFGGYLVDEERADVFTASVGNLPPGKEAILRLTTVSELPLEGDAIRFTLPTTIAPRYAPADDRKGVGETAAERVSPPYALQVPYGLTLEVDVRTTAPVRSVESPSHPISVTIDDGRATVRLSEREAALDRDVVLKIALAETHQPRAVVERGPDGDAYALVSFRPKLESALAPAEVVFLVDRSGSMQGDSIAEAKNALQLALRSLRPGCRFNIVGFGSSFHSLFPESRAYDDASLAEATEHVKHLAADLGGTEILPALEHVLASERQAGLPRQLFVLTDGEVSNTDAVIALGRKHAGNARIFTFGIGAGASHHLVKGLARAGEGEAEFIAPGERIEAKVLRQLSRALAPALSDVTVDWGGLDAAQSPHEVPPVFADGRVLIFAKLDNAQPATVTLCAIAKEGPVTFELSLDPASAAAGTLVGTLWARGTIRDLEEGRSELHPRRGSRQTRALEPKDEKVKAEIVRLGAAWSLVSRHTSFVAVEERETPTEGEAQLRKVPVAITRGWHGHEQIHTFLQAGLGVSDMVSVAKISPMLALGDMSVEPSFSAGPRFSRWSRPPRPAAGPPVRPLDRLVALQRADGSWRLDDELARVIGWRDKSSIQTSFGRALAADGAGTPIAIAWGHSTYDDEMNAAATALALEWLRLECADTQDEWRILAQKAHEWLRQTPVGPDRWCALAREALTRR